MTNAPLDYHCLAKWGLDKSLFESGQLSASVISVDKECTVFSPGDQCGAFLIIVEGSLRVDMTSRSGRELLLYRMQAHDTCIITTSVLLNQQDYYARAFTETAVTAIAIPSDDFHKALTLSNQFSTLILQQYSHRMSALIQLLDKVTSKDILFEFCQCLLQHSDNANIVHMTQDSLAKEIGTAREVVSRKLSILEGEGLVKALRGRVEILDVSRLDLFSLNSK